LLARDTRDSNRLHKSWRKTKFCRELNKTLTGDQSGAVSSGEDSETDAPETNMPFELSGATHPPAVPSPVLQRQPNMDHVLPFSQLTPLPPDCFRLLESYLTYTQSWLPICEKLDVLKLSYTYPSQGLLLSPDMPDSGSHAEMFSMLALGSCHSTEATAHRAVPSPQNLYSTAQALIPNELGQFHLGHVKALLNLGLFNLRRSNNDAAWLLVGAASRILPTIREQSGLIESRRTHVVAGCYLLDHLLALSLYRRPYLEKADIDAAGKIEEDGLEEW